MQTNDLSRFLLAQETSWETALSEITKGRKTSHWMWFIFPQLVGLGQSHYAQLYGIIGRSEAEAYLHHPVLGKRLTEISKILLDLDTNNPTTVMGRPDDMKLKSSMTLFESVYAADPVFSKVLDKYFRGERDQKTLNMLKEI